MNTLELAKFDTGSSHGRKSVYVGLKNKELVANRQATKRIHY
jgi:hypothetical protein